MGQPRHHAPLLRLPALRHAWCILIASALWSAHAAGQPRPEAAQDAARAKPTAAITHVVNEAVKPLAARIRGGIVVGAPLESDTHAPRAAALVARLVGLVAGAMGPGYQTVATPMALDAARAEASSSAFLIYVQTEVARGQLRLTTDAYPIPRNIWDRSRRGAPAPVAHGFGSARIDAEVRTFLAPILLVASEPIEVPLPSPEVMALSCGDIDGDGALELLVVSRRSLALGRIRAGKFAFLRQVQWRGLSPIAPVPWRQPLATLSVSTGQVDVGLTDRAHSIRLDGNLKRVASYAGMPVPTPSGVACSARRVGSLTAGLERCVTEDAAPVMEAAIHFDAVATARVVGAGGDERHVWAVRSPTDGSLALRDDRDGQHTLANVGAQIALGDLDLDGDPELLASKNVLSAVDDALVIRSWRKNGTMEKRVELPVPDGIRALAVCPVDGPGQRTVAIATSRALWVLR